MNQFSIMQIMWLRVVGVLVVAFIMLSAAPLQSHAAGLVICGSESGAEYNDATAVNSSGGSPATVQQFNNDSCQFSQILPEIIHITNWLISGAGLYAVAWLVFIGFRMILYSNEAAEMKKLKGEMMSVILGLVIVLLAFVLVNSLYDLFQIKINGAGDVIQLNPFK